MLSVTRVDSRRVLVLGVAGLVPAALVTLLLVHQPSIGDRRLYPMLREALAVTGLLLALATLIAWATAPDRRSRSSLSGLAWAGVTVLLCIGPFLESNPRGRLFALDLTDGHVAWASSRAGTSPVVVGDDLVVTDAGRGSLVGLDPASGRERWRRSLDDSGPLVVRARAAGASVPLASADGSAPPTTLPVIEPEIARVAVRSGERALAVRRVGDITYVYVSTHGATGLDEATLVKVEDGAVRWTKALPAELAVQVGVPSMDARGDVVVIAGGEEVGAVDADDGRLRWSASVANLAKSRGYTLPGSVQQVTIADAVVYLAATPEH